MKSLVILLVVSSGGSIGCGSGGAAPAAPAAAPARRAGDPPAAGRGARSAGPPADAGRAELDAADEALFRHEHERSRELLTRLVGPAYPADVRVQAEVRLATLAWRYFADPATARAHLDAAERLGARPSDAPAERSRMATELGDFDGARAAARRSLAAATTAEERERATVALGRAILGEVLAAERDAPAGARGRVGGRASDGAGASGGAGASAGDRIPDSAGASPGGLASAGPGARTAGTPAGARGGVAGRASTGAELAREALALVRGIVDEQPGALVPSRLQVGLALLAGDGPAALAGWRSYFHLPPGARPVGLLAGPGAELARLLPGWSGPGSRGAARVARALAGSRFFAEAVLAGPLPRELRGYARFTLRLERLTDSYYQRIAAGRADPAAYRRQVLGEAAALWPELTWTGRAARVTDEALVRELDRRFGALVNFGTTAGQEDLHMGHRVVDDRRVISQYGHTARVRFIEIDSLVSNGFESWAWDGRAQHGGWADEATIVQVRPAVAQGSIRAWQELRDPAASARARADVARDSAGDDARAAASPHAFLPGLRGRLRRQGLERLLARVTAGGASGEALRVAFVAAYERATVEGAIFAHEGRHAIDRGLAGQTFTPADLEFRANLSQVVFAPEPRLDLAKIFDANIGDATPHGQANLRAVVGAVAWMKAHAGEIAGLDRARPLFPQFDRLTDEQIRAAFGSMDPLRPSGPGVRSPG